MCVLPFIFIAVAVGSNYMADTRTLINKHNLFSEAMFRVKISVLIIKRSCKNLFSGIRRFDDKNQFINMPIASVSESDLWSTYDTEQNHALTTGKVHNLRIAAKRLNGLEIPANEVFSFWKHIGNPNFGKGYVVGREIREGCIVPAIAGGMCQLSNALYDAVLKAGFEVLERHRHTKVIRGSLAEQDRDATVKWNYIDLRFKAPCAVRIEIDITADKLVVQLRAKVNDSSVIGIINKNSPDILNDCYSCGNTGCFNHPGQLPSSTKKGTIAFVLDEKWKEYDEYVKSASTASDTFIVPFKNNRLAGAEKFNWTITKDASLKTYSYAAFKRVVLTRLSAKRGKNIFASSLLLDKQVAKKISRSIPINATHLVISQNLLPFLWAEGILGGRTYDVLMTRLPMETLHKKLDIAHIRYPDSRTLNDFRAPDEMVRYESEALNRASRIVTPHAEISALFNNKSVKLEWHSPVVNGHGVSGGRKILFPASAVARKGAYEMKRLANDLNLQLVVTGNSIEREGFWEDVKVEKSGPDVFKDIGLVVYPAYIEHSPQLLLKAIALGIPVITTTACGIPAAHNVTVVPTGNYDALKVAVGQHMEAFPKKEISSPGYLTLV